MGFIQNYMGFGLLMYAFVIPFMYIEKKRNRLTAPDEHSMMG